MKAVALVLASVSGVAAGLAAAPAPKCQDIPLRVTLYNNAVVDPSTGATTPSALRSDGGGEYTTAAIRTCSGTNDAVTPSGKRTFTVAFPAPIAGSVIQATPSWVPDTYALPGAIAIRNILYNKGGTQPFATMAGAYFEVPGDRASYRLGFKGTSPTLLNAPNLHDPQNTPGDNTPFASSPVVVYPTYPTPCGPGSLPRWLVRATSPNAPDTKLAVGTLHQQPPGNASVEVHEGQYAMPFEMLLEAMQCFAY